ncbi:MAG TPA: LURP-one-related family protein, partial [Bacillota bacterium]|nr:LURP-one-related family protein [Bacillota bacterium]
MKLYIRQKVFSWVDRFAVKDEAGNDKYFVEGEFFSWGKKLHVSDLQGNEVAFIQQKVFSFLPKFFVFIEGSQVAEIVKEFTFFRPKYSIQGLGWEIEGSFMAHDYEITRQGRSIVTIHK